MQAFLKENSSLIAAVILPILFALFFFATKTMVNEKAPQPQYDFVISNNTQNNNFDFQVIDGAPVLNFIYPVANTNGTVPRVTPNQKPKIFYVDAETLIAEPIGYSLPNDASKPSEEKQGLTVTIDLPSLEGKTLSAANISPDGYSFERNDHRDGNIMTELYSSRSYKNNDWGLLNDKTFYPIQGLDKHHSFYNGGIVGWVIEK
jgi:hypothetical protein